MNEPRSRPTLGELPGHVSLCHQHLRKDLDREPLSEDIAADILSSIQNLQSAAAINALSDEFLPCSPPANRDFQRTRDGN